MKPKVLFVDDDLLMHRLYGPHIERAGYEMISVTDGAEAIELASRELPQVVIMDIMMPGTDGVAAILQIKKTQTTQNIPVIAISGYPEYHCMRQQLTGVGVELFLPKPFGPAKLVSEIRRLALAQPSKTLTLQGSS
jgi:CheY-like chemotaxis protein